MTYFRTLTLRFLLLLCGMLLAGAFSAGAQTPFWQPTGGPGGGDVHALAVAPDGEVFAAAGPVDRSNLYHSTDGGETWSVMLSHEEGIRNVAVSPQGTIFAALWRGALLQSADGGQTWEALNYPDDQVWAMTIDPEGRLLIGGSAVYRSADEGQTWESLGVEGLRVRAFAFAETGEIVVATTDALYRSGDDGISWSEIAAPAQPAALAAHPNGRIYIGMAGLLALGEPSGLFHLSKDDQMVPVGLEGLSIRSLVVDAEGRLFAGTAGTCTGEVCFPPAGVFRSTDGGATWEPAGLISTPVPVLAVDAQGTLYAGTKGLFTDTGALLGRGIVRSEDYGATWASASQGMTHAQTYGLYPGPEGALYATADHSVYRTTDHGAHWVPIYTSEPTAEAPYPPSYKLGVHPEGDLFLLAGHPAITTGGIPVLYMQARLLHSSDQGETWTEVAADLGVVGPLVVTAAGTLLVAAPDGVMRSEDRGVTWTKASATLPAMPVVALETVASGPVFTATYDPQSWDIHIFRSTDDGVTWAAIGSMESVIIPERITLAARDAETLYAGSHVFQFIQPGSLWAASHLELLVRDVTFDAEGTLYATTGNEMFRSLDDGATWEPLGNGLPSWPEILTLAIDAGGYLYAASEHGVFRSILPVSTSITPQGKGASVVALEANYPNPFRRTTHLPFTLVRPARVTLTIYDLLGRPQATLLEEVFLPAGPHEVAWTAGDLPSGMYVYTLRTEHTVRTGRLMLLR